MFISLFKAFAISAPATILLSAVPANAQSATGTIGVRLNITNACVVNDATALQTDLGRTGDIHFTDQPGTFSAVDGELVGALGALAVRCSPGATPALTIGAGANDQAGVRQMVSGGSAVPYRLYTNAARNDEIGIGRSLALGAASSAAIVVPIYARATTDHNALHRIGSRALLLGAIGKVADKGIECWRIGDPGQLGAHQFGRQG